MREHTRLFYKINMVAFLILAAISVKAQKLPTVQVNNIFAPEKLQIDGKVSEWNNFQAYNKNTGISYTIANDEKNLYLVIQSATSANNNKIIRGGITFTVNTIGKKQGGSTVLFPVVPAMSIASLMQKMNTGRGNINNMSAEQIMKRADSVMNAANKEQLVKFKEIKIKGFPSTTDSIISIYNEYGIKTAASLDKNLYTYELAIPLESLGLSVTNPKEFNYNIKVNGIQVNMGGFGGGFGGFGGGGGDLGGGGGGGGGNFGGGGFPGSGVTDDMLAMITAVDFWGKYTLVKK